MRTLVIIGAVLLVVVGLLAFALINLNNLIASNKDRILHQVAQTLGREVEVQDIGVSVWGGIGARLTQFRIADDPAFSTEAFVQAEDLQVNVALWPLLSQEIQVSRLILNRPQIQMIRDAHGQFNFTSLTSTPAPSAAPATPPEAAPERDETAAPPLLFLIAFLDIHNGEVRYLDQQAETDFRVSQLDLRAHDVSLDQPVRLEFDAAVLSDQQNISLDVQAGPVGQGLESVNTLPLDGRVTISQLDLNSLQHALPALAPHLPSGLGIAGPLSLDTDVSGRVGALQFSNIDLQAALFDSSAPNLQVAGSFGPLGADIPDPLAESILDAAVTLGPLGLERVRQFAPVGAHLPPDLSLEGPVSVTVQASGQPNNMALTGQVEATDSALRFGERLHKPSGHVFALSTQARLTPQTVALQELKLNLHTLVLTVSGQVDFADPPTLDLTIASNRADLAQMSELLPPLQDYGAAGSFETQIRVAGPLATAQLPQLTGTLRIQDGRAAPKQLVTPLTDVQAALTLTGQGAELTKATARLGQSALQLEAQIEQLQPLQATYAMQAEVLNMADLQAQVSEDRLEAVSATGRVWLHGEEFRHAGQLSSAQGRVAQMPYTDLQLDSTLANHVATLKGFRLHAFEGRLAGSGQYDFGAAPPHLAVTARVDSVNLTEFFRSGLALTDPPIQGTASLDFTLSGSGHTWDTLKPALHGQGQAAITEGALREFNLAEGVLSGLTGIPGVSLFLPQQLQEKYPAIFASPHTEFEECTSQFSLSQGKINLDHLRIAARDFRTEAQGWMDFAQRVEATASLTLSEALSSDLIRVTKELQYIANAEDRVEIPFALAGVFPSVTPVLNAQQISALLQRAAAHALQEAVQEKVLDKILPSKRKPPSEESETPPSLEEELLHKGLDALFGR